MEQYIIKQISNEDLLQEVAYHEAGHLIFGFLVERLNLGFKPVTAIEVFPAISESTAPYGKVVGLEPPKGEIDSKASYQFPSYSYSKTDDDWLYAMMLQSAAGYATYKAYVDYTDFFISIPDYSIKREIRYHQLRSKFLYNGASDITAIKDGLKFMNKSLEEYERLFPKIFDDSVEILKMEKVRQAADLIKSKLIEKKGERISGKQFNEIREKVNDLTTVISLLPTLNSYETSV